MGQLYDQESWAQRLPQAVVTALMGWLDGKTFSLRHRDWFDDGRSGEPVARVVREWNGVEADQRVLKFFKAGGAARVANIRQASRDASTLHNPSDFGKRHIAEVEDEPISLGEWSAIFLHIASDNLRASRQLGELFDEANFPDYCATVVHSVLTEWNDNRVSRRSERVADIVKGIMGRRQDDVLAWAVRHGFLDGPPLVVMKGWPRRLPNPFRLVTGAEGQEIVEDLLVGKAHGDLNGRNVLIPVKPPKVDADSYVLIDCDRYSDQAPLARDPMHLLVALALDNFDEHGTKSRKQIASVLVDPNVSSSADRFQKISVAIHGACRLQISKGWGSEWDRQCLLSLIGVGLVHLGRDLQTDDPNEAKEWCFHLAALAAEAYLQTRPRQVRAAARTMPKLDIQAGTTGLVDRRGERTKLWTTLTSGSGGVVTLSGTRGIGKTALVNNVLGELSEETGDWAPSLIRAYEVNVATPLDVRTLVDCVIGEFDPESPTLPQRGRSPLVRLESELQRLGDTRVVVSIDSAENLLDPDTEQVDRDLDEALEMLATDREHLVTVLLVTQRQLFSPNHRTWSARPPEIVESMPDEHYSAYLASMDQHGRMAPGSLPEVSRQVLFERLAGNPRLAELALAAIIASNGEIDLAALTERLDEQVGDDIPKFLTNLLIDGLSPAQSHVLEALAAFDTPVPEYAVRELVDDVSQAMFSPTVIHAALSTLVDSRVVHRTRSDQYFVPSDDCALILRDKNTSARATLYVLAVGRLADLQNLDPRRPADLRVHFAMLTALLNAGEYAAAYNIIELIDGVLREWNCAHLLRNERKVVAGRLRDSHLAMANWNALGDIYTSDGRFPKASKAFGKALSIANNRQDDVSKMRIHGNLAAMYWEKNDTHKALSYFELVRDEAIRLHDPMVWMGALEGIADCHRRRGDYGTAVSNAENALAIPRLADYPDTPRALSFATSRTVSIALKLARWFAELERPDDAERLLGAAHEAVAERPDDWLRASYLDGRADVFFDRGDLESAAFAASAAEDQALRLRDPITLLQVRTTLCLIHLARNEVTKVRRAIERAQHYRREGRSLVVLALHALADRQMHDRATANKRFEQLYEEATGRIRYDERDFAAWDFKGFAICGLYLDDRRALEEAVNAFRSARDLTPPTPALVRRMRLILDKLDESGSRPNQLAPAIAALGTR
jgi:tetratricopeptide (TPR) repeat protein